LEAGAAEEDLMIEVIHDQQLSTLQFAVSVARIAKYHSDQVEKNLFFVGIVFENKAETHDQMM